MRIVPFKPWIAKEDVTDNLTGFISQITKDFADKRSTGIYEVFPKPCILLHQIKERNKTFRGIICLTDLKFRWGERIFPHESTLISKEKQIRERIESNQAMLKPVLLTHEPIGSLNALFDEIQQRKPIVMFEIPENTIHSFWAIDHTEEIEVIRSAFHPLQDVFLADGHHRYASMLKICQKRNQDYCYLMTTYFDFENLKILPYHRILDKALTSCPDLEKKLSEIADLQPSRHKTTIPKAKHEIILVMHQSLFKLRWKSYILNRTIKADGIDLDSHILNKVVFEEIFRIEDSRTSIRIKYVDGRNDLNQFRQRVSTYENAAGFFLHPISGSHFVHLSKKGQRLPPKSTWFEPRIMKGLIVYKFPSE